MENNQNQYIVPIILAGGEGSRLWPLSRSDRPKQFLRLFSDNSMIQETALRAALVTPAAPITVCNEKYRFLVAEHLQEVGHLGPVILEPAPKNTAPAIAVAAMTALQNNPEAILLVLAADHLIQNDDAFVNAVAQAVSVAEQGGLATFGIVPAYPETGYGYVQKGTALKVAGTYKVQRFVEKPAANIAEQYVASGEYFWNSGMFVFKASDYLAELQEFSPAIYAACKASFEQAKQDLEFVRLDEAAFLECPSDSIDYAVMEKTTKAAVVPLDAGWSDIGSFSSCWDVAEKDAGGNNARGDVVLHGTTNSFVSSESSLVATLGVDNLIVIQTKDAVLVADKGKVQDIKQLVQLLRGQSRTETDSHREVYRPWGVYDSVDNGNRYQVKRITVKPGAKLSVQMHHHRAEHWVVVSGTAKVAIDGEEQLLIENESVYIPVGAVHSLHNPGKIPLELIEVQSGPYLGEDDIVRFEDNYGRC